MKKIISVLVAALMLLPLFAACQLTDETPAGSATPESSDTTSATTEEPADDAVAATVGEETITYGELKTLFDTYVQYFAYYGYDVTSDETTLNSFQDDLVKMLVQEKIIAYKAHELGYDEFTDEQKAEIDKRVQDELSSMDEYYREQAIQEAAEDATIDVDARVMELIVEEAAHNMGDDNATYEQYVAYITDDITATYLSELLKAGELKDVTVSETDILTKYTNLYDSDSETYSTTPASYKAAEDAYESSGDGVPALYVPEGYCRMYDIFIGFDGTLPEDYTTNQTTMATLKGEYQELAFADAVAGTKDNAARMGEIIKEYSSLQAANDAMYDEYASSAKAKIEDIYAQLEAGGNFKEIMLANTQNTNFTTNDTFAQRGMLIAPDLACDNDWKDATKAEFKKLAIGEYSAPYTESDGYHIIYYVSDETAGTRDMEDEEVNAALNAACLSEMIDTEWTALLDEWMNSDIVTLNEEVYRNLGKTTTTAAE